MWRLAACALCTAALQLPSRPPRTRITLHAVDDDAELCVALTVHKPPRVDGTKVPSPLSSDTAFVGDGAAVLASAATEKGDLIDRAYAAAGPRSSPLMSWMPCSRTTRPKMPPMYLARMTSPRNFLMFPTACRKISAPKSRKKRLSWKTMAAATRM